MNPILDAFPDPAHIPHLLFQGSDTEYKYNCIYAFLRHCTPHIYYMNCAHLLEKDHCAYIQDPVHAFAQIRSTMPRLIVFDHATFLSLDAQAVLRRYIEQFSGNVRFVFITNGPGLISPILSRVFRMYIEDCPHIEDVPHVEDGSYVEEEPIDKTRNIPEIKRCGMSLSEKYEWAKDQIRAGVWPADLLPCLGVAARLRLLHAQWRTDALFLMHFISIAN